MASLLLPELGITGGFILLTISKNWLTDMLLGITSASYKNLKQHMMGNFFSKALIYYHLKSKFML